ncbi:tyrosinase cofactor [Streptomyces fradiae]|uniref:tyrosinase cofactor n=1 Tax=Streptomyces fradiae TaxID=1906 RepID=UPI002019DDE9|nr:tyrosinase cofactor [Streptomyces fradiae]UQS31415.1 tyrosinase [Streptomyces fradiae]
MTASRPKPPPAARTRGHLPRRTALRALFTAAVAALTGGALARVAATPHDAPGVAPGGARAGGGADPGPVPHTSGSGPHASAGDPHGTAAGPGADGGPARVVGAFAETYRGRRIEGRPVAASAGGFEVLVDGRPLHLMRCADGGYLSLVNHYEAYPTALAATRAAVDELGGAVLAAHGLAHGSAVRSAHGAAVQLEGGRRGVHA